MPGRLVRRSTYVQEYEELTHKDGVPFVPGAVWKDMIFSAAILFAVAFAPRLRPLWADRLARSNDHADRAQAGLFLPVDLRHAGLSAGEPGDAVHTDCSHRGHWLSAALPFFAGEGEKSWQRRPIAVLSIAVLAVGFAVCQHLPTRHGARRCRPGAAIPCRYSICIGPRRWGGRGRLFSRRSSAAIATCSAAWVAARPGPG